MDDFDAAVSLVVDEPEQEPVRRRLPVVNKYTINARRISKRELERGRKEYPLDPAWEEERPVTRGDCIEAGWGTDGNPCPWVSCKHNLYLDVNKLTGSIKLNFPGLEPHQLPETCALHIAERDWSTLEDVGKAMNLTRERIRQLETRIMAKLKAAAGETALEEFVETSGPEVWETARRRIK